MEPLNYILFRLLNATPASPDWVLRLASFIAIYLVAIVPLLMAALWFWGAPPQLQTQRTLVGKSTIALALALTCSTIVGMLFPHARPFVTGIGYSFLPHAATSSFPSNHASGMFTFALSFLYWHRHSWPGLVLLTIALCVAWARVYLGVHWPLDMLGGLLVAMLSCLLTQWLWIPYGHRIMLQLKGLYRYCFALPIRKGWVKN